jgi:hypothetical protein
VAVRGWTYLRDDAAVLFVSTLLAGLPGRSGTVTGAGPAMTVLERAAASAGAANVTEVAAAVVVAVVVAVVTVVYIVGVVVTAVVVAAAAAAATFGADVCLGCLP